MLFDVYRSKHHGHFAIKTLAIVNTALRLAGGELKIEYNCCCGIVYERSLWRRVD